jgi:hypothetical protein
MAQKTASERPGSSARSGGRRHAAGIYGTIITAAVLAAIGSRLPILPLVVSILVTLLVYWVAEEYAELLGEQLEGGRLPAWPDIRTALATTWPMVSASFAPLSVVLAWWLGASSSAAANVGLIVAVLLMIFYGWSAGRAARLHGKQLAMITSLAAALGLLMILLKDVVLIHLH